MISSKVFNSSQHQVLITDLKVTTVIGVHDWEKKIKQDVFFNITLNLDFSNALIADDLTGTVDYDHLTQRIIEFAEVNHFNLIETLADQCSSLILNEFNVDSLVIQIDKPTALSCSKSVGVKLFKSR